MGVTHARRGNPTGAQRLLDRATSHLTAYVGTGGSTYGLDLDEVLDRARHCVETAVPE